MPYPLALAALAVSAAGAGAQMAGQSQAQSARDRAQLAEMNRQREYRRQAAAVADQSISESGRSTADPAIERGATDRAAAFNAIVSRGQAPLTGNTVNRIVPNTTQTTTQPMTASAAAWNRILGGAQARLGGYSDWGLARNIAAKRAGQKLDTIGTNARASADILAADLQDANHAGDGLMTAGSILGTVGSLGGLYGAMGGFGSAPAAFPTGATDTMDTVLSQSGWSPYGGQW